MVFLVQKLLPVRYACAFAKLSCCRVVYAFFLTLHCATNTESKKELGQVKSPVKIDASAAGAKLEFSDTGASQPASSPEPSACTTKDAKGLTVPFASEPVNRRYKVLIKTVVRTGPQMNSEKADPSVLAKGFEFVATEQGTLPCGTARVHFEQGWVSTMASDGRTILELLEDLDEPVE